ncbi:MAG TPA: hypothetical protein VJ623_09785 [Holophagaceae bacterium]|nr:hypothetical protein [Holophagaceae bacterium]
MNASPAVDLKELELKINVSLRLLARFASLNRRWPANPIYLELIRGIEAHLEYWEYKRRVLKEQLETVSSEG